MSTFNLNKPSGNYRISFGQNILSNNQNLSNEANKTNNKAKNIRLTLTPSAIRNNKFDISNGNFDTGYPLNTNKTFCDDKLSTVFNTGNSYWTKSFSTQYSYPIVGNLDLVSPNNLVTCNTGDGEDECLPIPCPPSSVFDINSCSCVPCSTIQCPPGQIFDPSSCLCVNPPICTDQSSCDPIFVPENIKNTIYGYAFYLDTRRSVAIPGITTPVYASCAGGHVCCRTLFRPKLIKSDTTTEILADRTINMNNSVNCLDNTQIPVPGFSQLTPYERSDTFTITLNNPSDIISSTFYLDCVDTFCHTGVTFVVLVAELASSTERVVIFSSCITPGATNRKPIGTIDCEGEPGLCNGDVAFSCYDGICRNVISMGGIFGQGLWLNDPTCNGECAEPPCEDNPYCCLYNYCSYEPGIFYETIDPSNLAACDDANSYTCCNGLTVTVSACEPAGFSSSISGVEVYDCTVTVSNISSPSPS